ncbi:MAG: ubiquinone biosynthesis protein [Ottowia sp.]
MSSLFAALTSFPAVVYTVLLGVVLVYWLLAIIGLVDFEAGADMDIGADAADAGDIGDAGDGGPEGLSGLAAWLVAFGLNGVPFSIVASLLALVGWFLTGMASLTLLPLVPDALRWAAGAGVLLAAAALSIVIAAQLVRPMRGLFVTHRAISNAALVGQVCKVLTGVVDERQGRAEVAQRGAGINIRVWAPAPNSLRRGDAALITEYDSARQRYRIDALPPDHA